MDIRRITPDYAVSPQILPEDCTTLVAEGFKVLINNRPDMEITPDIDSEAMRRAAEAAGLVYVDNPVMNGGMTMEMVTAQGDAVTEAAGPVFAYCRSGTRSAIIWALSQAGRIPTQDLVTAAAQAGYDLGPMVGQIEALAGQNSSE